MVNHYTLPAAKNRLWCLFALLLAIPTLGISQSVTTAADESLVPSTVCGDLTIENISWTNETVCDAADGQLYFTVSDDAGTSGNTYRLEMDYGTKVKFVSGLTVNNGQIVLSGLYPSRYANFVLKREADGCNSAVFERDYLIEHACDFSIGRTGCGSGSVSHTNCDDESITIYNSNIDANTYIHTDNDYLGCIAYVDHSCDVQMSQRVMCLNYNKTAPTPGNGYDYGEVTFERIVGASNAGYTDLVAERINYAICNGEPDGYSRADVNRAIWYITGTYSTTNQLADDAIANVTSSNLTGVADDMVFFIPNLSNIQPFVDYMCLSTTPDPPTDFSFTCDDYIEVEVDGTGTDCSASPDAQVNITNPSSVYQVELSGGITVSTGPDVAICVGSSVTIMASASNGTAPYTFNWSNGLGAGESQNVAPTTTTTYSVTATDANGCTGVDQITVTVNPTPTIHISKTDATCGEENGSATASASGGTSPYTFMWSDGLGTGATQNNLAPGTYGVTVLDANGCFDTGSVTINGSGGVTVNAGDDETICEGEDAHLAAVASGGTAPYHFQWSEGLGSGASKTVSPVVTTTYVVTVTDDNGCTDTDQVMVDVIEGFDDPGTIGNDESVCGPYDAATIIELEPAQGAENCAPEFNDEDTCDTGDKPIEFTLAYIGGSCEDSNPNQADDKWDCSGSAVNLPTVYIEINDNQFSGTVSLGSSFTVYRGGARLTNPIEITIYDEEGGTQQQYIEIHTSCSAPIVLGSTFGAVQLLGVVYENGEEFGSTGSTITYQWQSRTGTSGAWSDIPGATGVTYDPGVITTTMQYRRKATDCCGFAFSNIVTKTVLPEPTASAGPDQLICVGESVTLTASGGGSYLWNTGTTTASITVSPAVTTFYAVTVTNAAGCTDEASAMVEVSTGLTDAGTIEADESDCAGYDAETIIGVIAPSGSTCPGSFVSEVCCGDENSEFDKISEITIRYTGEDCSATVTTQPSDKWSCDGDPNFATSVWIKANDDQNPDDNSDVWFTGTVSLNGTYLIEAANAGETKLKAETFVHIFDEEGGTLLQTVEFHTSCSQDLATGDQFGANLILSMVDENDLECGAGSVFTDYTYQWEFREGTSGAWTVITGATGPDYDPGFINTTTQFRRIASDCCATLPSNIVTKEVVELDPGDIAGDEENCGGYDAQEIVSIEEATGECTAIPPTGEDTCDDGDKPVEFTLAYIGGSCEGSNPNQPNDKWDCSGSAVNAPTVYIVDEEDGQFSGTVTLGQSFVVTNGGDRLENPLFLNIYSSQGGTLLQELEIHTSCSAPIVIGSTFGALQLLGVVYENGVVFDPPAPIGVSYQWQQRTGNGSWVDIPGATGETYDPPFITQTTEYRRLALNCCGTEVSNIVTKEVSPEPVSEIVTAPTEVCEGETATFEAADCTGTTSQETNITLQSTKDDFVYEDKENYNHGSCAGLAIENYTNYNARAFVEFNVGSIDPDAVITSAQLVLTHYNWDYWGESGSVPFSARRVTQSWTEGDKCYSNASGSQLRWSNQPSFAESYGSQTGSASDSDGTQYTFNVTNLVQGWIDGTYANNGIALVPNSSTGNSYFSVYATGNNRPRLIITYATSSDEEVTCNYQWTFPGGTPSTSTEQNPSVTWNTPGERTVTLTVSTADGCDNTYTTTVTVNPNPTVSAVGVDPNCGDDNGSATASASGGMAPYSFEWSTGATTATITDLAPGTYDVTATDAKGCMGTASVTINEGDDGPIVNAGDDQEICVGESLTLTATTSAGTAPVNVTWMPGNLSGATITVSPGSTTTYTATATDANGCVDTDQVVVTVNPNPTVSVADVEICAGDDATLTAVAGAGTPGYTYEWSTGATSASITVSPGSTTSYSVTVTDSKGCTASTSGTVTVNPNPVVSANGVDATCGDDNGSATASANGGTAPYTYAWSNGDIGASITGLAPGTYTVTATDSKGCSGTASVTINNIGGPTVDAGDDTEICAGESTTLTATTSGGTAPISITWMPGNLSGATITVSPGSTTTYTATATDANGCVDTDQVVVTVNPNPTVSVADIEICAGDDGTLTAVAGGGTPGYTYEWSMGATSASITVSPGSTTSYSVTVTDSKGCSASTSGTVTVNPNPTVSVADIEICAGDDGILTAVAGGGTPGYIYEWSTGATSASITVSPGSTTSYSVTVTDSKGCTASTSGTVTVNPNPVVSANGVDATCGDNNGTATASASGGMAPYSYAWSNGDAGAMITGLAPGTYTVTATDSKGCTGTASVTINNIGGPTVDAGDDTEICAGESTTLTATTSGGTAPISITWMPGNLSGATITVSPGSTTTYTATATDANGCTDADQVVVTVNPNPTVSVADIEICAGDDGTLTAVAGGGTPGYTYEWSTGATTTSITVSPGATTSYSVTVTDSKGCTASTSGTVTVNPNPTITSIDSDDPNCESTNGSATANVSGGTPPYSYAWSNGGNTQTVNNLAPGTYTVTVTDAKGCMDTGSVTIADGLCASIDIEKATNGEDADEAPGVIILVPNTPPTVTWTYVVTNTGPLDLINVQVNDDQEGFIGTIPFLASGDSFTFTRTGTAIRGQYSNNSTVVGTPVDENGDPTGDPDVEDEDPSNYVGVFINIDKEADRDEICAGEEVNFTLTLRLLGGVEGIQLRDISVTDSNLPDDLMPYDAFFDPASDLNGNGFVDFIDNDNDGESDEEFVWNYTLSYDETTTNEAEDMAQVWYVDPNTGDEFFIGNAMNMDAVTVTVNQDLCASLGDFVWEDLDADGIQDAGEPGIENVTVMLLDGDGNMLDQTTTDNTGFYEFTELIPGDYIVKFTAPGGFDPSPSNQGGDDTVDSDADETTGQTGIIDLESGENDPTNDAGYYRPASLGDFVWEDLDGDGIQEAGEPGVEDVTVNLKDAGGNIIASTTTDNTGFYEFTDLVPGTYSVQFDLPAGIVYTDLNAGGDDALDSDADPAMNGMTATTTLESGENDPTLDAGIVRDPELNLIKNLVDVQSLGDEQFVVTYEVIVGNNGGATQYDLKDTPLFDDDITITGASYATDAPGNAGGALAGSGPWSLADDQFITTNGTHTYTITVNVTRDLSSSSTDGGDNIYTPCAVPGNGPGSAPGQGLYNLAELDEDNDGQTDLEDDACGDLPNIEMVKDFGSATPNGDGTYTVTYTVTVSNTGGAAGAYALTDTPQFDDDITINGGSFSGQNSGGLAAGTNTLATNEAIAAGATHTYNLSFNVTLNLTGDANDNDGGDNVYDACSVPGNGPGSNPGEGLYNLAELDNDLDGDTDIEDDACGDLPNITLVKDLTSVEVQPDGSYRVVYTVTVQNTGGADGDYRLLDSPLFDDDITINAWDYTFVDVDAGIGNGPAFVGAPPVPIDFGLRTLTAGNTHIYTIGFDVTLDLTGTDPDGGDDIYTACSEPGNGPGSNPGEGLYNLAEVDTDNDGDTDLEDDACGDLPNLTMVKDFGSVSANGDGTYTVTYNVIVSNNGGAEGTYTLYDTPLFDDDVTINGGSFSGQNAGALTAGQNTLATAETIAAGVSHTYNLSFNVTLDLSGDANDNDGGDNQYVACSEPGNGPGSNPGEGLYNLAELDVDNDGDIDIEDDACGDLPNITMVKDFGSAVANGDGTYTVTYTITVGNTGGADGSYTLTDTPQFDDDIVINSGSFSGQNSGLLGNGLNLLATNEAIAAGATHVYNLSFVVTLDLTEGSTDGGDNVYTACSEPGNGPGSNPGEGLYNLAELDSDGDGDTDIEDDACGDLPNITLNKDLTSVEVQPDGSYRVVYTVTVQNTGGADGDYRLLDSPLFDDDITINAWDYTFVDVDGGVGSGPAFVGAPPVPIDFGLRTITAGNTHIYTIGFDVTLDLTGTDPDGGDDIYTACSEPGNDPGSNPGEGLYNLAELDIDNDGDTDLEDDACGDLPNLTMVKDFGSVSANGDGTYTVTYNVIVSNTGGAEGTYTLYDTPQFDDDVTINGGSFSGQNAGALTDGQNTLAVAETIAAGASHTYNLSFNVTLDLTAGSNDGGDNVYTVCSDPGNGPGSNPGEGLYNLAELDVDNDGDIDIQDDACGDLPNLVLDKDFVSATPNGDGTYTVLYTVTVENNGGAEGIYSLQDTPSFDDDVVINSGSFSGQNSGALTAGANTLATGETIAAGTTHTYNLSFNVSLSINMNSTDGGDNEYTACGEGSSTGVPAPGEGLYNLAELDEDNDGDFDQEDDACGDLPLYDLALTKDVTSSEPYTQGSTVTYAVVVTNEGEIDATNVEVTDTPDAGLNYVGSDADGIQVTDLGGGIFSIASLPIGQSETINLTYTIDANFQGTSLLNKAEITEDDPYDDVDSDPETSDDVDEDGDGDPDDDDEDEVEIPVNQVFDLALRKTTLSSGPFTQGSTITYQIEVINQGSLDATDVEVTDYIPAGLNLTDGAWAQAGSLATRTIAGPIAANGGTATVTISFQVDANFQGTSVVNYAEISDAENDLNQPDVDSTPNQDNTDDAGGQPNSPADDAVNGDGTGTPGDGVAATDEDDHDSEQTTISQRFDLALRKTVLSAGPFEQGSAVTYQVEIINQGSIDATNVQVTDYIPAGLTLIDGSWAQSGSLATRTIAGPIAANGGTATVTISFQIDATFQGTSIVNFAEISDAENALGLADDDSTPNQDNTDDAGGQPNSPADDAVNGDGSGTPGDGVAATDEDDHDPAQIAVDQVYDLALTKDLLSAGPFSQGSNVTFTISVTNEGSLDAANVEVTDRPDADFNFVGANVPANVIDNGDGTFVILDLDQGETETWEVTYQIDPGFQGFLLVNEAEITEDDGDDEDSTPDNDDPTEDDQDDEEVPVEQTASIDIEKATNGQDADNAPGVIIIVPNTPPVVTWTYVVTNTGTLDLVNVIVTDDQEGQVGVIPFLAAGATETLTLTGTAMRGQYTNLATVVGTPVDEDGNENPNGIDDVTDEDPSNYNGVFINVEKVGDRDEICAGEEVTFTLTVRLLGGTEGVQLRDINVADSNLPNDLMPYDAFFDPASDLNGNGFIDFIDNNNDGISDEEFVWTYTIAYDETTTNFAEDMAEVWYVDPNTNDEFFIGTAMNNDEWTVTVNQDLCASLGDYVWEDYDGDGIQDDGEPGVPNVTVNLKDENGNIIDTQTTGPDGEYLFTELTPGTYSVQFELPTGFTFTDLNAGGDDTVDSDADPAMNGMTDPVTLDNGDDNRDQDAGIVRDPDLDMVKDLVDVTDLGNENFQVTYTVTVTNNGGATEYDLKDTPLFDDDITITGASYSSDAPGNAGGALAGSGPWTLADDQFITTFGTHVYTITVDVNRDLSDDSTDGGDNVYTPCAVPGNGPGSGPGQGLYNLAELDGDNDGQTDIEDDACGDLPNIEMVKDFGSATPNGDGTYTVTYTVTVSNTGGAEGSYTLTDTPQFDDDITINSGSFSGQNSGALIDGANTLATDETIAAGATHVYNLSFNVTLDLSGDANDNDGGDNEYTACSEPGNGPGSNPGEGLYNLAELDRDGDGDTDIEDDACGDLPNITMVKDFGEATANGDGTYTVTYTVTVANNGGAAGEYTLTDTPQFDDDITINSGSFSGQNSGALIDGANTLATDESIAAGATHVYNLSFNVTLDLSGDANDNDGGDNQYTACSEPGNGPGSNPGEGLYNLAELDSDGDGDTDIEDDACGDLPNLLLNKDLGTVTANGDGTYTVTYVVTVSNNGGAEGSYTLTDTPQFDDDVTINSGSFSGQNSGSLTDGANTLAVNESIAAGATHTYNLSFNVTLDLTAGSNDGGDNVYTACSEPGNGPGSNPGEGLYNLAELDVDNDGDTDLQDDACGDLPNITMVKDFGTTTLNPDGSYTVTYTITVGNDGGAEGIYNLWDTPQFDDDITINFGSFSGQNSGGLSDATNILATNEPIAAGATHTYNLSFNVTLDLSGDADDNDGGDNEYTACSEPGDGPGSNPGEGLYNLAELDADGDGDVDVEDDACGDLPNITLDKILLGVTDNGDGTFTASYQILVSNNGGAEGSYSLDDVAEFDDDVIIISGGFLIERGGTPLSGAFVGDPSPLSLATNEPIAPGATHTYTIDYLAELDLDEDSTDGGDNVYTECEDPSGGDGSEPGQGLYNRAELDLDGDGEPDLEDDVCGDVPTADLSLVKVVDNETPDIGDVVTFTITVTNDGPQDATGVGVEDVVPNGYSNIGNISNSGALAGNVINWDGISLLVGESIDLTFTATVNAPGDNVDYVNIAEIDEADQYDEDSTPGNGADSSPGNGIGSEDPDGTQDPNDEDDGDDAAVMPPCLLSVEFEPTPCNDNGTPTNPNDDFFEIVATVTGLNASGSWTAIDSRGNTYTGTYGTEFTFGPYSIFGNEGDEIIITITDSEDEACFTSITATTPEETCSTDCIITVTEPQTVECLGSETNTPDDDEFIFTINVTGVNVGGEGWRAVDQFGNEYFGEYGSSQNNYVDVGPYAWIDFAGQTITLTVTDVENPDCGIGTIELDVPTEPCSQDCSIELEVQNVICDDNGTPWDPSDDVYWAWVLISGNNASFQGWITDDPGRPDGDNTGTYGLYEFGPYPISGGNHVLTIRDRVYDDCEASVTIQAPPGTCSDGCRLDVFQQPPVCDDNGTSTPDDDVYYVTVTVQPLGQFGDGWRIVLGNGMFEDGGPYGEPVTLGPYLISEGIRTIEIADNQYISCNETFEVVPPEPCSSPDPCTMEAGTFTQGECNDNGTPADGDDDFYVLTYSAPNVTNPASTQYELLIDGVVVATNDYGTGGTVEVPADGQTHTITWRDAADPDCSATETLPAIDPCTAPCDIDYNATFVYNDNGTPLDFTDDFYELIILVTNSGENGGCWTITNMMGLNETHPYGTTVTIGPIDANMDFSATISDCEDPECSELLRKPGQAVVGDFTWIDEDCDGVQDPGEAGLAGITVTITGTDMMGNAVTGTTVTNDNGQYLFTNLPAGFDYKVTFELPDGYEFSPVDQGSDDELDSDAGDMGMTGTFMLMSSSSNLTLDAGYCELVCSIEPGTFSQGDCQYLENNSMYVLTFGEPTITNGCGEYEVLLNGVVVYEGTTGDGGSTIMVDADGEDDVLTFRDACDAECSRSVTVPGVDPCPPPVCTIEAGDVTQGDCDDNGTDEDTTDDFYVATFMAPTVEDGCGQYVVLLDGELVYTGDVGDNGGTFNVPADGNSHFVQFRDACDPDCEDGLELAPVDPCSEVECVITAEITEGPTCQEDGSFEVTFTVTGQNAGVGWFATDSEGNIFNGFYGIPVTRTYTDIAPGTSITVTFIDLENGEDCNDMVSFDAPDCDEPCALSCVATPSECDNNGTPDDPSDDTYTATILVVGQNTGSCFTYEIGGETFTGTYGVPFEVGPFPISEGNVVFPVTDCDDSDCSHLMLVLAPEPCSDGPEITVECPISNHFCPILDEDIMLYRTDPFECTATVEVAAPEVSGACNDGNFTFTVELVNQFGVVLATIEPGEPLVFEDVALGDYYLRYTVTDDCGTVGTRDCTIRVADIDEPVAICVGALNVQLGGWGLARLYTNSVDMGSYDNCAIASIELRRHIDRDQDTCEDLDETEYSDWGPYVQFTCCDASTYVTVEMRVTDVNGNYNICWLDVLVEDKTLPYCTGLEDELVNCDDLPDDFDPFDTDQLSELFGTPEVIDNCSAEAVEQDPIVNLDADGNGTITRTFIAIDAAGNESSTTFEQVITIFGCTGFAPPGGGENIGGDEFNDSFIDNPVMLLQNYPNPASNTTVIPFVLPRSGKATIDVFDATGSVIHRIEGDYYEGLNEVRFDVSRYSDGLYFYQLRFDDQQLNSKMIITKQ